MSNCITNIWVIAVWKWNIEFLKKDFDWHFYWQIKTELRKSVGTYSQVSLKNYLSIHILLFVWTVVKTGEWYTRKTSKGVKTSVPYTHYVKQTYTGSKKLSDEAIVIVFSFAPIDVATSTPVRRPPTFHLCKVFLGHPVRRRTLKINETTDKIR